MTIDSLGQTQYLDTVSYESSRLYYNISERIIYLVGRAQVNHTTVTLKADTITFNTTTKNMRASSTLTVADDDSIYGRR
jgi:lipopolysaccharide export system protein LptA